MASWPWCESLGVAEKPAKKEEGGEQLQRLSTTCKACIIWSLLVVVAQAKELVAVVDFCQQ